MWFGSALELVSLPVQPPQQPQVLTVAVTLHQFWCDDRSCVLPHLQAVT